MMIKTLHFRLLIFAIYIFSGVPILTSLYVLLKYLNHILIIEKNLIKEFILNDINKVNWVGYFVLGDVSNIYNLH